jgi:hypothetical protein
LKQNAMTSSKTSGALPAFRRTARGLPYQATFQIPTKALAPFIDAIAAALGSIQTGRAILDEIVFEPRMLSAVLATHSLEPLDRRDTRAMQDWSIDSTDPAALRNLLSALLSDAVDFAFVPTPKPFVIYADHDEYATFFAARQSNLNRVLREMSQNGFEPNGYHREY